MQTILQVQLTGRRIEKRGMRLNTFLSIFHAAINCQFFSVLKGRGDGGSVHAKRGGRQPKIVHNKSQDTR